MIPRRDTPYLISSWIHVHKDQDEGEPRAVSVSGPLNIR